MLPAVVLKTFFRIILQDKLLGLMQLSSNKETASDRAQEAGSRTWQEAAMDVASGERVGESEGLRKTLSSTF